MTEAKIIVLLFVLIPFLTSAAPEGEGQRQRRSIVTCDYFNEAGFRCNGCHEAIACYPFNIGTVTNCSGLFPYCRNGFCSRLMGSACANTTTTSSTTTSTTSSSP